MVYLGGMGPLNDGAHDMRVYRSRQALTKMAITRVLTERYGAGYLDGGDYVLLADETCRTHATVRCEEPGVMIVQGPEGEWRHPVPEIAPG